ncbi:cytochrome P450 [Streptomyces sp. NPDC048442]|uniref:cytochrome P450 family protein n=1 Tax=Streptomyces sp. NPDC048442 TaxID=3154823 RepID=UPI00342D9CFD
MTQSPQSAEDPPVLPTGSRVDPYPMYAEMRERTVVQQVKEPNGLERWLILTYEQARDAFNDERLSKDPKRAYEKLRSAGYVTSDKDDKADYLYHLLNTDPPDHTRLRRLVGKAFTMRRVEELRPRVEEIADGLIDSIASRGEADLVEDFSHPLSVAVICEMLGVPPERRSDFRRWATAMLTAPDQVDENTMGPQEGYALMRQFFTDLLAEKRAALGDVDGAAAQPDVLSGLIAARDAEDRLSETELISTAMLLLSAGQEPTVNLINNGMLALFTHPDQMELLKNKPELLATAVDEFLRFDPPVELSTMRVAVEDIEIAGTLVPAGSVVTAAIASAHRDGAEFDRPDELDVARTHNPHLAFGHGIHHCVGAPLARLEGQVAVGALLRRLPDIALGCATEELSWRPTRIMRGLTALPVVFTPQA